MNNSALVILTVILTIATLGMVWEIWKYLFPRVPAFVSKSDYKDFLKLTDKQFKEISRVVKSEMATEMVDLLNKRDAAMEESMRAAESGISKKLTELSDASNNNTAKVAAALVKSHVSLMITFSDAGVFGEEMKAMPAEDRGRFFTNQFLETNQEIKQWIHIKI